jgi:hypothetical protein
VIKPRAADDFPTIRARLEELRRERECVEQRDEPLSPRPVPIRAGRTGTMAMAIRRLRTRCGPGTPCWACCRP